MKTLFTTVFSLLLLCAAASAQTKQTPDFSTVKTDKGMVIVNNNKSKPFVFLAAGKNPQGRQMDDGGLVIEVGDRVLYVYFIKTSDFLDPAKTYNEAEILYAHRDWDVGTQEKSWRNKLNIDDKGFQFLSLANFKRIPSIYWSFQSPDKQNPSRAVYQTVLIADVILMLGTAIDSDAKLSDARNFLQETFKSLTFGAPRNTAKPKAPRKTAVKRESFFESFMHQLFI